jgi:hypothetical protein
MNNFIKLYYSLCTPAKVYFLISVVSVLALIVQNIATPMKYKVGSYSVNLPHNNLVFFVFKFLYIIVWTFILNELCSHGWKDLSWFLVLFPLLLMFVIIALLILANMK